MFVRTQWLAYIQGKYWVIARVKRRKNEIHVLHLATFSEEIPEQEIDLLEKQGDIEAPDIIVENEENQYLQRLKNWLKQEKVSVKKLKISVSIPGVITRIITLPIISKKYLDKLLTEEVAQYFTVNITDYVLDYRVLKYFEEDGQKRQLVLVAALPKQQWVSLWTLWEELGFSPRVVDLAADCLTRLYGRLGNLGQETATVGLGELGSDVAIIDLGNDRVEFLLLDQGTFFLYSDMQISLAALKSYAGLSCVTGDAKKSLIEETEPSDDNADFGDTGRIRKQKTEDTILPVLQTLDQLFSFFAARHYGKRIDLVYLTGEYADRPFLPEIFKENIDIDTMVGFPDGWKPSFSEQTGDSNNWMKYGSLYGLAMRED
ncbi:pilus assembly protein PilM [Desulfosporosinus sp. Sb-LF]|uniref:pilus assembly protein PilM n=1 Tax=Desulfosporosinus sp. Sb-LF TaxID=2560027 RepID=UPI00107FB049|nr:pilus assembly protein PilM [Desulfosporosinus sp. Sb-LF]TGE34195.1 pilus assembly protein PilM [Desulfosporosinus sp. Sb-LF]